MCATVFFIIIYLLIPVSLNNQQLCMVNSQGTLFQSTQYSLSVIWQPHHTCYGVLTYRIVSHIWRSRIHTSFADYMWMHEYDLLPFYFCTIFFFLKVAMWKMVFSEIKLVVFFLFLFFSVGGMKDRHYAIFSWRDYDDTKSTYTVQINVITKQKRTTTLIRRIAQNW